MVKGFFQFTIIPPNKGIQTSSCIPLRSHVLWPWQPGSLKPHRLIFFPKVPRRRQRMGCPMIRRHKDSCTSPKFSKLRIEVEQRAKEKLNKSYDCQKCWLVFEDQHLVRHLTPGFNLLDPDRWKSAKIQVCTRRQASMDQCPVRNHRDLTLQSRESNPGLAQVMSEAF